MCPVCGQPMVILEFRGVEIDRCLNCGGTWLDAGELEWISERAGIPPGDLSDSLSRRPGGRRADRRCPRCRRRLREITLGKNGEVRVDRCPRGQGLWFDKGEVAAVIRSFAEGQEGLLAEFFAELSPGGGRPPDGKG